MVRRDYSVRCRRCGHPYKPEDISRVRTCIFCRKISEVRSRDKKLDMLVADIRRYFNSSKNFPVKDLVLKWLILKFDVNNETVNSYINELISKKVVEVYNDGFYDRVRVLD